ncbi:tail fiber domain-containing protein [Streptomyces sp. NPDC006134]|uniref:tail fiber domain-containing protein n=1 Tax=Streptomyces sp. NPDC006134 TaxID=3154467 RepID=UPI0033F1547E
MAITSYPFDNQAVTESQWSLLFRELSSGVAASSDSTAFKVTADSTGMKIKVQPGFALVRGHAVQSTAVETLPIAAADSAARTDAVVLRLDPATNGISLAVLKGTPGSSSPALTQTDTGVYEIRLAWVAVGASVTTITAEDITEARQFARTFTGSWWTSTRPTSPRLGDLGFNRTSTTWEFWDGAAWRDLAPAVSWSSVSGKPSTFPPTSHEHSWSEVTGKPGTFPPSSHGHTWDDVSGKPATYPPASHSHSWSSITSKPSTFPPSSHSHSQYLTSGSTISWANGSKRPHTNSASGSGTWYAVWVEGDGQFCRNTSSIRFKQNVRDHEIDPADVLALRPVIYDRKPTKEKPNARKNEVGLIAEEVEQHLPWLVNYHEGQVDGLRYDLLGVALLPVVQDQAARINALESRLAAIEARFGEAA